MSYFLDFRTSNVGGAVVAPHLFEGDGTADPLALVSVAEARFPAIFAGRNLCLATHGFNVSRRRGACSLGLLDSYLNLDLPGLFVGVLWPGDCWLPVVDYPFEGDVAVDCGKRLAAFCNEKLASAQSISFLSHSLGARLILEATARLHRPARSVCLAAGAINRDCLTAQYALAATNSGRISLLSSRRDDVLKIAFAAGDPIADLLNDDHNPFQSALGYSGPPAPPPQSVSYPWQIPDRLNYGHGDYLPPGSPIPLPPPADARWLQAAEFMRRAFMGQQQNWPPV